MAAAAATVKAAVRSAAGAAASVAAPPEVVKRIENVERARNYFMLTHLCIYAGVVVRLGCLESSRMHEKYDAQADRQRAMQTDRDTNTETNKQIRNAS